MLGRDDLDDFLMEVNKLQLDDNNHFQIYCNRYHKMVTLHYDLCQFLNIKKMETK